MEFESTDVAAPTKVDPSRVAVLGSTGSIGSSTLDVIAGSCGRLSAHALTAHYNLDEVLRLAQRHRPRWLVATDRAAHDAFSRWDELPEGTEVVSSPDALSRIAADPEIDVVVSAIVGSAGLEGTWAAVEAGKRVALANKETLVVAGSQVMKLAHERSATILPVDSEHSAIFQALQAGRRDQVKRVVLTASGGPFRSWTAKQMAEATVEQALHHPTWEMGRKITIDSATMMNKALEIIEARWLFDLQPDQIDVVIHPQSIVHSLVEFKDGSVVAQMSPPDMKLPIEFALNYPDRLAGVAETLDWSQPFQLEFEPPDPIRFPALTLGHEVARVGGTAGVVVNAANEAAVAAFLQQKMRFCDIVAACQAVLDNHDFDPAPALSDLNRLDAWARQEVFRWNCC